MTLLSALDELEKKARVSPEVAFDSETESGRFYSAASPDVVLKLINTVRVMREALEWCAKEAEGRLCESFTSTYKAPFSTGENARKKLNFVEEIWKI